jgi:hypothetical protein
MSDFTTLLFWSYAPLFVKNNLFNIAGSDGIHVQKLDTEIVFLARLFCISSQCFSDILNKKNNHLPIY